MPCTFPSARRFGLVLILVLIFDLRASATPIIFPYGRYLYARAETHELGVDNMQERTGYLGPDQLAHSNVDVYMGQGFYGNTKAEATSFQSIYPDGGVSAGLLLGFSVHAGGTYHAWPTTMTGGYAQVVADVQITQPLYVLERGYGEGGALGSSTFTIESSSGIFQRFNSYGSINRYIWLQPDRYTVTLEVERKVSTQFGRTYANMTLSVLPEPSAGCLMILTSVAFKRLRSRNPRFTPPAASSAPPLQAPARECPVATGFRVGAGNYL
jgi:hypothetical protein